MRRSILTALAALIMFCPATLFAESAITYPINADIQTTDNLLGIDNPGGTWAINRFPISSVINLMSYHQHYPLAAAPASPFNGQEACADGNNWQPGGAEQGTNDWLVVYRSSDTTWVPVRDLTTGQWILAYASIGEDILDTGSAAGQIDLDSIPDGTDYQRTTNEDAITFIIDGNGGAITSGVKGFLEIPWDCTIESVTLLNDQTGSIVVGLWVDSYANYPPTVADSITSATPPTVSSGMKIQDETLTGWTTALTKGQVIGFNVNSATTVERVTVSIKVTR